MSEQRRAINFARLLLLLTAFALAALGVAGLLGFRL